MDHGSAHALPAEVSFPYGFPQPGDYRLFVQIKRRGQIETGCSMRMLQAEVIWEPGNFLPFFQIGFNPSKDHPDEGPIYADRTTWLLHLAEPRTAQGFSGRTFFQVTPEDSTLTNS